MPKLIAHTFILRSALVVAGLFGCFSLAKAEGNAGTPDSEIQIGKIETYKSEGQAKLRCGRDTVVWADRYAGYIYFPREAEYGRSPQGSFACLNNAKNSNYWTTGPMSSMGKGHGPGRNFPFTPIPLPPTS